MRDGQGHLSPDCFVIFQRRFGNFCRFPKVQCFLCSATQKYGTSEQPLKAVLLMEASHEMQP
jgi:hypothetical protein